MYSIYGAGFFLTNDPRGSRNYLKLILTYIQLTMIGIFDSNGGVEGICSGTASSIAI
jgi:hypothetical protein